MKKYALLLVVLFLFCSSVDAGPKNWIKRHKRILAIEAVAIAGASVHAYGLAHCRSGDVERCDAHYGASWMQFGFTTGLNVVVFPSLAMKCYHEDQGGAFCGSLAYTPAITQAVWGVHEYKRYRPEAPHPPSMANRIP